MHVAYRCESLLRQCFPVFPSSEATEQTVAVISRPSPRECLHFAAQSKAKLQAGTFTDSLQFNYNMKLYTQPVTQRRDRSNT